MNSCAKKTLYVLVVSFVVFWSIFPLYWAVNTSLQGSADMAGVHFWPTVITLKNYYDIVVDSGFLLYVGNSMAVATITVLLANILGAPAAFALARCRFRGMHVLKTLILVVSFLPPVVLLGGLLNVMRYFDIYDNFWGLVLSYMLIALPFTIWSVKNYLSQIPREIEETAMVDGVSVWRMCVRIFFPLSIPAFITTSLIAFVAAWNEFLLALTMVLKDQNRTATVAITLISSTTDFEIPWGQIMAAAAIVTIPLVLLVLVFQKRIVAGVTMGAVKG